MGIPSLRHLCVRDERTRLASERAREGGFGEFPMVPQLAEKGQLLFVAPVKEIGK